MRPSPIIRARIFAYLYYGLRRFKMHAVVELIPLLLHMPLILFFAGLVAFLHPVNTVMTAVAAVLLLAIASVYGYLTVLPILHSDCPYRTPLSGITRNVFLRIRTLHNAYFRPVETPDGEVMTHHATSESAERTDRDCRSLVWTMKSLTDDDELEPFVEAIPDIL
ncbi:hypothetical protein DFH09DRAFT_1309774 [Mycena vulgaris]|nr:hypothetical protein DFH09DRAFT_1309774 [Mycena vulgaris]